MQHKLSYFRSLYNYEKENASLSGLKMYIDGGDPDLIKDYCTGVVPLPSPFLLDELQWNLSDSGENVHNIMHRLKITSRNFYLSLVAHKPGEYGHNFVKVSSALGGNVIDGLTELRSLMGKSRILPGVNEVHKLGYSLVGLLCSFVGGYLGFSSAETSNVFAPLYGFMSAFPAIVVFASYYRVKSFGLWDMSGRNLLVLKYRTLVLKLQQSEDAGGLYNKFATAS